MTATTTKPYITVLAGESFDLKTDPDFAGLDCAIVCIHPEKIGVKVSARTKTTASQSTRKRDRSTDGVFENGNASKTLEAYGLIFGSFDAVYVAPGTGNVRLEIEAGA